MAQTGLGPIRYAGLIGHFRDQIRDGDLVAGDRLPSFAELQTRFGISPCTVNRAMIEMEREGLIVRERRRGVFVAHRKTERQHSIGLASFSDLTGSPYYSLLTSGVVEVAHRHQYEVTLLNLESMRGLDKVDGVLVHGEPGTHYLSKMPPGTARVALMMTMEDVPSVLFDDFGGAREATRHLLELGHRHIEFVGHLTSPPAQRRVAGYDAEMRAWDLVADRRWVRSLRLWEPEELPMSNTKSRVKELGYVNAVKWIADGWLDEGLTAIIAQNDEYAIGVMRALREAGVSVPDDVSVIGFDSTALCDMCSPRLTSVHLPLQEAGAVATDLLLRQIHEEPVAPFATVLPVRLEIRESTAPVRRQ